MDPDAGRSPRERVPDAEALVCDLRTPRAYRPDGNGSRRRIGGEVRPMPAPRKSSADEAADDRPRKRAAATDAFVGDDGALGGGGESGSGLSPLAIAVSGPTRLPLGGFTVS